MKNRKVKTSTQTFDLVLEGQPVNVKATLYETHNTEARYRVSINGSPVYIFGWDSNKNCLAAIDSGNAAMAMPPLVEAAIGQELYNKMAA
ncbi:MAG: hypothetical protein J7578_20155 [Chitinophagaceae bacterium]|nr:hypothetical protein [Chitinophagaceae bacterium]